MAGTKERAEALALQKKNADNAKQQLTEEFQKVTDDLLREQRETTAELKQFFVSQLTSSFSLFVSRSLFASVYPS